MKQIKVQTGVSAAARHIICVIALMWTPLLNGEPFFFQSDTTNYIRAADAAVYMATNGKVSTVWTNRYRDQIRLDRSPPAVSEITPSGRQPRGANDMAHGMIMGGRSPYIGALMYLGYIAGDFWPFVLFQALVAYGLIILTLKRFGIASAVNTSVLTLGLAATTAVPTYNGLLLADAFAGFGILAFLLLATPGKLTRLEQGFLCLVLAISVTAHLTHIMIVLGMTAALAAFRLLKWGSTPPRRAWITGCGAVLLGFLSVQLTAVVTEWAIGHRPQLLPLLTARFIADGPGKSYIDAGCPGHDFVICHVPIGEPRSDALILFGSTSRDGAYMLLNVDQRRLMGDQDTAFARAVLRYDPIGEIKMMALNTARQLLWIDYDGLNQHCFSKDDCWTSLPPSIRAELQGSLSGRGLWPQALMNALLYAVVIFSLIALAILFPSIAREDRERGQLLREWLLLGFVAMLVCSFFGGAVADPQYRYQGRLIWLVPLMAGVVVLIRLQVRRRGGISFAEETLAMLKRHAGIGRLG